MDGRGITGFILHYSLLFALFGGAVIAFIYLACKRKLQIDEEAKYTLFEDKDE